MSLFSDYNPEIKSKKLPDNIIFRHAKIEDIDMLASITHHREGGDLSKHKDKIENEILDILRHEKKVLFVAVAFKVVVGFARAAMIDESSKTSIPTGIYLTGVIVDPAHQRFGIARELTKLRLDWAGKYTKCVFYFVNDRNNVSIRLHKQFGFKEVQRNFEFPGVTFSNGVGVLFRLDYCNSA